MNQRVFIGLSQLEPSVHEIEKFVMSVEMLRVQKKRRLLTLILNLCLLVGCVPNAQTPLPTLAIPSAAPPPTATPAPTLIPTRVAIRPTQTPRLLPTSTPTLTDTPTPLESPTRT